jgi:hypothetical protein
LVATDFVLPFPNLVPLLLLPISVAQDVASLAEGLSLATITSLRRAWVIQNRTRNAAQNNELTFLFAPFPVNSR